MTYGPHDAKAVKGEATGVASNEMRETAAHSPTQS